MLSTTRACIFIALFGFATNSHSSAGSNFGISISCTGKTSIKGRKDTTFKIKFRAYREKFHYEIESKTSDGQIITSFEGAYDGIHTYLFIPDQSKLVLSAGNERSHPWIYDTNPLYYLFSFSTGYLNAITERSKAYRVPSFDIVLKASNLMDFIKRFQVMSEDNHYVEVAVTEKGFDPLLGLECPDPPSTVVTLDKSRDLFPISWRKSSKIKGTEEIRSIVFKVNAIGTFSSDEVNISYPKEVSITHSNGDTPYMDISIKTDDIYFGPEVASEDFTIDFTKANYIEDTEKGQIIAVPK